MKELVWKRQDFAGRLEGHDRTATPEKRVGCCIDPAGLGSKMCVLMQEIPPTWYGSNSRGEYWYLNDLSIQGNNFSGLYLLMNSSRLEVILHDVLVLADS